MKFLRSRRILRRVLTALLVFIGVSFLSVFLFYGFFFRRTGRSEESQETLLTELVSLVPGGSVDRVSFDSDSNTLCGYFLHPEQADGILVFAMGKEAKIGDHLNETKAFLEDGWNVLIYYGTGCGASEGTSMVGLTQGKHDLSAALGFLRDSGSIDSSPLAVYGHSMGAYAAAALTDEVPDIDAVVCVAGFDSSPDMMIAGARSKVGPLAYAGAPFIELFERMIFGSDAGDSASESISVSGTPALLVQFDRDPVIPREADIIENMENKKAPLAVFLRLGEPYAGHHNSDVLSGSDALDSVLVFLSGCR